MIFKILQNYWYLFLVTFIIGGVLFLFIKKKIIKYYNNFISSTPAIRRYWTFVIAFSLSVFISYILILNYSKNIDRILNILGQISTLIFAIFVGYFAFLQVVENRIDKLKEEGHRQLKEKAYDRAIKILEEVHSINISDFSNLAELIEIFLIQKYYEKFDKKISLLEKNIVDKKEKLLFFYLKIFFYVFKEHISDAKQYIDQLVEFRKTNPNILPSWDFSDLQNSESNQSLQGDSKKYSDNIINYLRGGMSIEDKQKFESGNYLLI